MNEFCWPEAYLSGGDEPVIVMKQATKMRSNPLIDAARNAQGARQ